MRTKIMKRVYRGAVNIPLILLIGAGMTQAQRALPTTTTNQLKAPKSDDASLASHYPINTQTQKAKVLASFIHDKFNIPPSKASTIVAEAFRNGRKRDLQPELILAVIAVESTFKEKAVSPVGARGLMQVMPSAHPKKVRSIGGSRALYDPKKNISVGAHILAQYLDLSSGNLRRTLLRYNGSLKNSRSHYPERVLRIYHQMKTTTHLNEQLKIAEMERSGHQASG